MLTAIEKNSKDFEKGKISKETFKYNDNRMKKERMKENALISDGKRKIQENKRKLKVATSDAAETI